MSRLIKKDLDFKIRSYLIRHGLEFSVSNFIDAYAIVVQECIRNGDTVVLNNFGRYIPVHRKDRMGRNPRTGESALIKARTRLVFKPSGGCMNFINNGGDL